MAETALILTGPQWRTLAAAPAAGDILAVFVWFAIAAVATLCGFYVAVAIRRWTQREETVQTFTFQDLRDMRARGQINEQEFAAMRSALLAQLQVADEGEVLAPRNDRARRRVEPPPKDQPRPPEAGLGPPEDGAPPPVGQPPGA